MSAPIPNTCPDINAVQADIQEQSKVLEKTVDLLNKVDEPCEYVKDAISNIEDVIHNLEPLFTEKRYSWHRENPLEALRQSNETLRSYGQDMEEENNVAEARISELEEEVESLKYQLSQFQNDSDN